MPKKFSHVIVIGVDGAGGWFKTADTPSFDRIFKNGAITYNALSSMPTISAECWGSMLIGVGPEIHGLTNSIVYSAPYDVNSPFPTIFKRIRAAYPDAVLGSYCDWEPISRGIIEHNAGVSFDTGRDVELTPRICSYISQSKPDFLFVHFDSTDGVGHRTGYGLPAFMERIHVIDKLIGDIHSAISESGMLEETLFIVIADHGGANNEDGTGDHGGWSDEEKYVTFAAAGKGVNEAEIANMNIRDLASIVLYALGIEAPEFDEKGWTSQIPKGLFKDYDGDYRDISHITGAAPRISKVPHQSELV